MKSQSTDYLSQEKNRTIDFILVIFAVAGSLVTTVSLLRVNELGMVPFFWVQVILVSLAVLIAAMRKSLPYSVKTIFAIGVNLFIGVAGVLQFGLVDGSVMLLITAAIVAALLGGTRWGVVTVVITFGIILSIIVASQLSLWSFDVDANQYMTELSSWLIFLAAFTALTLITIYMIGRMTEITNANLQLLKEKTLELEASNQTKDQLFKVIAHDLRSPFQGLISGLELFSDENETFTKEQRRKLLDSLLRDSTSTFAMLENLLYWSRSQTEEITLNKKYIEASALLNVCIAPYERLAERKNIELQNAVETGSIIFGDESSLKIVFSNLISNAIKFTPENGKVKISALSLETTTELSIKDTGVGVDWAHVEAIFDKKQNFNTLGTDSEKGTGLGLGISYELIQRNAGQIRVEANPGGGSDFIVRLPNSV